MVECHRRVDANGGATIEDALCERLKAWQQHRPFRVLCLQLLGQLCSRLLLPFIVLGSADV